MNKNKEVTIDIENPKGNDVISREDALMALTGEWTEITDEIIHRFIRRIKALPSVKPQERTGHWIEISRGFECDQCHGLDTDGLKPPYCKWCGAKMIESQESER